MDFYEYEVQCANNEGKITHSMGIIAARCYSEAAQYISDFYGEELEQINYLRWAETGHAYEFNNSEFGRFKFGSITK